MSSDNQSKQRALKKLDRLVIGMLPFLLVIIGVQILPGLIIRQTEVVTVFDNDAAAGCRSRSRFIFWRKFRTDKPQRPGSYCGTILTDYGAIDLPQTQWPQIFGTPREELDATLIAGCKYEITVAGPGTPLSKGGGVSNNNRELHSIDQVFDCPSLSEGVPKSE